LATLMHCGMAVMLCGMVADMLFSVLRLWYVHWIR